jgi:probable rRNA maturation factor
MIELEILGAPVAGASVPSSEEMLALCSLAVASAGVDDGHIALEFVDEARIAELNERYRSLARPTDVLSFPVDGADPVAGARELGDVVICVQHTVDVREAIVHGVLHLLGMDHETDYGEMLARQRELLAEARR